MYILRLDDASEHMNLQNWERIESLMDKYHIKPIFGIIPHNEDPDLLKYEEVSDFWSLMRKWKSKGWTPALHGYSHVFESNEGGINPVNAKSEFAGVSLARQEQKIRDGLSILEEHNISPRIFFAPAHTFDENTLCALKNTSNIRIISDTIATKIYYKDEFYFIPQQSGMVRNLPFKLVTFCYHPNTMTEDMFNRLEDFLSKYHTKFTSFEQLKFNQKAKRTSLDILFNKLYFIRK